jgi:beta-lactamase class D
MRKISLQQVLEENFKNCMQIPFIVVHFMLAGWLVGWLEREEAKHGYVWRIRLRYERERYLGLELA